MSPQAASGRIPRERLPLSRRSPVTTASPPIKLKQRMSIGLDVPELSIHTDNDQTNREGTYYYPSIAAYEAAAPDLFTISKGNGLVRFASLSAALFFENATQIGRIFSGGGFRVFAGVFWEMWWLDVVFGW